MVLDLLGTAQFGAIFWVDRIVKRRTDMGAKRCIIESKHRHPKMGSYPMIWTKIKFVLNVPNIK